MNLFRKAINKKSRPPKYKATPNEIPMTIKVYLTVSFLVGQLTFFISNLTSFKKTMVLLIIFMVFKKPSFGAPFVSYQTGPECQ